MLAVTLLGFDLTPFVTALEQALPIVIAGGCIFGIMKYFSTTAGSKYSQYLPYVVSAIHIAEAKFPVNSANKTTEWIGEFLQAFEASYTAETGKTPDQVLLDWANNAKTLFLHDLAVAKASAPVVTVVAPAATVTATATTPTVTK